jgi:2-keto-4-pentenoate hydratase/2-oxohepta-3-ene-1,7-dioic acid hydratase in catechol pathway
LKLVSYETEGVRRVGALEGGRVTEIAGYSDVGELIAAGGVDALGRKKVAGAEVDLRDVKVRAPLTAPDKVLMAAVNYRAHGAEQKTEPPSEPYFFTKFASCIVGDGASIIAPTASAKVDWEVELAVVIGKRCKHVSKSEALSCVAGYTVANDVSFRDLQIPDGWPQKANPLGQNWVMGKALDSALPLGPCLATPDEIPDPQRLSLSLKVNGVERQRGSTEDMIFTVAELIERLSAGITLLPGDLISTGTPAGVALFSGAPYLKPGDMVEATVEGIGTLHNPVEAEQRPSARSLKLF